MHYAATVKRLTLLYNVGVLGFLERVILMAKLSATTSPRLIL